VIASLSAKDVWLIHRLIPARSLPTAKARVVFPLSSRFPETTRPQEPGVVAVMETVLIVALNATRDCGLNVNLVDSRLLVRKVPFEEYSRLYQVNRRKLLCPRRILTKASIPGDHWSPHDQ
jgi:hypothetical protein